MGGVHCLQTEEVLGNDQVQHAGIVNRVLM